MKILRKIKIKDAKMAKKDASLSPEVLQKADLYLNQARTILKAIEQEFSVGLKGGNFSAGYIVEKVKALNSLAKLISE